MNILKLIKNMFKIAKLMSVDDAGDFQFATVSTLGKTQKVLMLKPYGLMSNPPTSSMVALWNQQGQESNGIGIADDPNNRLFKNMPEGEVALGNYNTGSSVRFFENGDASLSAQSDATLAAVNDATMFAFNDLILRALLGKATITAPTIEFNGASDNLVTFSDLDAALQSQNTLIAGHSHAGAGLIDTAITIDISAAKANTLKTDG